MDTAVATRTIPAEEEYLEEVEAVEEEVSYDSAYYANQCGKALAELNALEGTSETVWTSDRENWLPLVARCKELVNDYNQASRMRALCACAETEDPMFEACRVFQYTTISFSEKTKNYGAGDVHRCEHKNGWKEIDLLALQNMCGKIGKNPDWYYAIQKLTILYTLRVLSERNFSDEVIKKYNDSLFMTKKVKEFRLAKADESGRTPNPVSKKQITNTIDGIIAMMIGDQYHCDGRDVMDLRDLFVTKDRSKPLSRKGMSKVNLVSQIHEIAYRVVNGLEYEWKIKEPRKKG